MPPTRPLPSLATIANRVARRVGASEYGASAAIRLRNQCQVAIGRHLAPTLDPAANGEMWLVSQIAPHVNRFIDVGANVGNWSAQMLSLAPAVEGIAVEPGTAALAELRARFGDRLEIVAAAAGHEVGHASLYEFEGPSETASLVSSPADGARARQVDVTTIDALLARREWSNVEFVKIDAEGFDGHVLSGAREALSDHRLGIVQFEYNAGWAEAGSTLGYHMGELRRLGYSVHLLRAGGLTGFDYGRYGEFFSYANFVAVAPDSLPWLRP
jgi:FkbM family methyltransferase